MKRLFKTILLAAIFTLLLSVSAFAADGGIYALETVGDHVATMPMTAGGTEITTPTDTVINDVTESVFEGAERIRLTYSGSTDGCYYLVVVLKGTSATPTSDNIVYIDQLTAEGTDIDFNVFPSELEADETYTIYLSSNDGSLNKLTKLASFQYYVPYTPGDVDDNGKINIDDAMDVIYHIVGKNILTGNALLAAEVTNDSPANVNINDAMEIIYYIVGKPQYIGK